MGTQDEQKAQWKALIDRTALDIAKIDRDTPYSAIDPEWWLEMMAIERMLHEAVFT